MLKSQASSTLTSSRLCVPRQTAVLLCAFFLPGSGADVSAVCSMATVAKALTAPMPALLPPPSLTSHHLHPCPQSAPSLCVPGSLSQTLRLTVLLRGSVTGTQSQITKKGCAPRLELSIVGPRGGPSPVWETGEFLGGWQSKWRLRKRKKGRKERKEKRRKYCL